MKKFQDYLLDILSLASGKRADYVVFSPSMSGCGLLTFISDSNQSVSHGEVDGDDYEVLRDHLVRDSSLLGHPFDGYSFVLNSDGFSVVSSKADGRLLRMPIGDDGKLMVMLLLYTDTRTLIQPLGVQVDSTLPPMILTPNEIHQARELISTLITADSL